MTLPLITIAQPRAAEPKTLPESNASVQAIRALEAQVRKLKETP